MHSVWILPPVREPRSSTTRSTSAERCLIAQAIESPATPAPTTTTRLRWPDMRRPLDRAGNTCSGDGLTRGFHYQARQRLYEQRMAVQRRGAIVTGDPCRTRRVGKEHIHLVERLDVIRNERQRDDEDVSHPFVAQLSEHFLGARSDPFHGAGARLKRQQLPVRELQALHHTESRSVDVFDVGISLVNEPLRQPVRAEDQHGTSPA